MNITPRITQILTLLLSQNYPMPLNALAQQIGVSKRTVQREFNYITNFLLKYNLNLMSKTGVGVWIEGDVESKVKLQDLLKNQNVTDFNDKEFRRKSIILELLREKGLKKIYWYSNKFMVSDATISADLETIEEWLLKYNLILIKKPGSGVLLDGKEENYRKAMRAFIAENINTDMIFDAYSQEIYDVENYNTFENSYMGQMLNNDILKKVADIISSIEHKYIYSLTESSYMGLILHIAIAITRILNNETVDFNDKWISSFENDLDYAIAKEIVSKLENEFSIHISEVEVSYICLHIKGSKHEKIQIDKEIELKPENIGLKSLVNDMIYAFDSEKAYYLKQDEEFIQGLLTHLQPTLVRLAYDMKIQNLILDDIKQDYSDIFNKCKNMSKILEEWTLKPIPESEIGFLTMHFGSAIERINQNTKQTRVVDIGIICSSGIGVSRLMSTKIQKIFQNEVNVSTYGKNDITDEILEKEDFFISSIGIINPKIIQVNPLLSQKDIDKIREEFAKFQCQPKKQHDKNALEIDEIYKLVTQIKCLIENFKFNVIDDDLNLYSALEFMSSIVTNDKVDAQIIKNDILEREKLSSQIYSEFSFALLHAKTKGVTKPIFLIFRPKNIFVNDDFKNIKTIFLMLIPIDENIKINSEILGYISSSLIDNDNFFNVIDSNNEQDILKHLDKMLKKLLIDWLVT